MQNHTLINDYKELPGILKEYKKEGKKIVLTQGTFDMLHIGHGRYLKEAKSYGDVLFVGVDSDEKVRQRKGPDRPVVPQEERMEMLSYLKSVNHVILKPVTAVKWELITLIHPDVLVATTETYTDKDIAELKKICGTVVVLEAMATTSTSAKIRRVQIGAAKKIGKTISTRLITAIEDALEELKE